MARMASKVRREFDASADVTLRNVADGAETASAVETAIPLNRLSAAYWDNGEQPNGIIMVNFFLTAYDNTTGDEECTVIIEVDTASAPTAAVTVAQVVIPTGGAAVQTALGFYEIAISSQLIERLLPTATHLRLSTTIAGTSPSFTYGAWATYLDA